MKLVKVHTSFIGTTGYNAHAQNFFTELDNLVPLRVRNFTIGKSWKGNNNTPHDREPYMTDQMKKILVEQTLFNADKTRSDYPIYNFNEADDNDIHLVLNETDHHYFYDTKLYNGYKIAYNVWETTLYPEHFFKKLLEYDELWLPTKWQRDCVVAQGYPKNKTFIMPEGVDVEIFKPAEIKPKKKFQFLYFGRWDYRKSTTEVVRAFAEEFANQDDVELILSADNPYSVDGFQTTQERLTHYKIDAKNIRIVHFPSREEYVEFIQQGNVFLSCARSEGWNLPLIEAMACGTPAIYSDWGGQLKFAEGKGLPVKILEERPASDGQGLQFNRQANGNYCEPDFEDLKAVMRFAYENYEKCKQKALKDAKLIHKDFNWQKVAQIGAQRINKIREKLYPADYFNFQKNEIAIVPCYCDTQEKMDMLIECITSLKEKGQKVLLTSHYAISDTIKNLVDYTVYDGENQVLRSKDYLHYDVTFFFWMNYANYRLIQSYPYNHSFAVWTLMRNGFAMASALGYKNAHVVDYDCVIGEKKYFDDVNRFLENQEAVFFKFNKDIKDGEPNFLSILFSMNVEKGLQLFNKWKTLREYCTNPNGYIIIEILMAMEVQKMGINHIVLENSVAKEYNNVLDRVSVMKSDILYDYEDENIKFHVFYYNEQYDILVLRNVEAREKELYVDVNNKDKTIKFDKWEEKLIYLEKSKQYDIKIKEPNSVLVYNQYEVNKEFYHNNKIELKENAMVEKLSENSTYDFEYVDREINQEKIYEKYFDIEQGDVVVDIGGHAGFFSDRAAKMGIREIYTIEPDADCCQIIKEKLEKSGVEYKVYNGAIADTNERLYFDGSGLAGHIVHHETDRSVQGITFQRLIEENNIKMIDFLKLDCEGGEYSVINEDNIELFKKVCKKVACEIHLQNPSQKYQAIELFNLLQKHGIDYIITSVDGVILSIEKVLDRIDYFSEVLLYISMNRATTEFLITFTDGAKVEIKSNFENQFLVQFIDAETEEVIHHTILKNNMWTKTAVMFYKKWKIRIYDVRKSLMMLEHELSLKDRNVLVFLDSRAVGDTVAWFPYFDEFQKKHGCNLFCGTFHNNIIDKEAYPNLTFVEMGAPLDNIYATYRIGWYYDENSNIRLNMNPNEVKNQPMQKCASDILGLEYKEVKPKLVLEENVEKKKQIAIAIHGTCQAKYWNNPQGWQEVVDFCKSKGYEVLLLSKEEDGYMGNSHPKGIINHPQGTLNQVIKAIQESVAFIGIGSGLSWLAWCTETPVVLISGFSEAYTEPSVYARITSPEGKCGNCFNNHRLDPADWMWCPEKKNFECTKEISSQTVIESLKNLVI
jgi:autotransporter strand-loop-strand O-heptosyltransferase